MGSYTKTNMLEDVENQAPNFQMPSEMEARFARSAIGGETLGLSHMKLAPDFRIPFGHKHSGQEEVYVVVRGSGRVKVEDDVVELRQWDAIRFDKDTMRAMEAGPGRHRVSRLRCRRRSCAMRKWSPVGGRTNGSAEGVAGSIPTVETREMQAGGQQELVRLDLEPLVPIGAYDSWSPGEGLHDRQRTAWVTRRLATARTNARGRPRRAAGSVQMAGA